MSEAAKEKQKGIFRINLLGIGSGLLIFFTLCAFITAIGLILMFVFHGFTATLNDYGNIIAGLALIENPFFWAGILLIYYASTQLDISAKVISIILCCVPVVHFAVLLLIIKVSVREYIREKRKIECAKVIAISDECKTRYPILLIHGIFFRDFKYFNYWGRIPEYLEMNGATVYYGDHESCETVEKTAEGIAERVRQIVRDTGCGKVNIIAHSKGGLDVKYAVAMTGIAPLVASVTTINTPHQGCEYAERLLNWAPYKAKKVLSSIANIVFRKLGDKDPDVLSAVEELTCTRCRELDAITSDFDFAEHGVYTQSVGSGMKYARSGVIPLNMSCLLIDRTDGPNDGLVGQASFRWGEDYTFIDNGEKRGISHGDMIDLTRGEIPGFDVCAFYVGLVGRLRERGL